MPFNESPGAPAIDWLRVKVIITSLYIISHSGCGFACPEDTFIPMTYQFISPRKALRSLVSSNNKWGQPKNAEGWWHPGKVRQLWHSLICYGLMELPIEPHVIRIEPVTLMSQDSLADKDTDNHWAPVTRPHAGGNKYNVHFTARLLRCLMWPHRLRWSTASLKQSKSGLTKISNPLCKMGSFCVTSIL